MTERLSLASNLVPETLIYGHLQIVYEDAAGNLLENEATSPGFPYFFGDWAYPNFGRPHDNTTNTPGYGSQDNYAIVSLELRPQQTLEHVWELLAQIHTSLSTGGHGIDYDLNQNSNSYVASVLSVVGIDIGDYLDAVQPPDVMGFPGVGTNIFQGAKTGGLFSGYDTPIPLTLVGTEGNDYIVAGIGNDLLGGAGGNDEIYAGDGRDTVNGGNGNDALYGDARSDSLNGGNGDDTLLGGDGNDMLDGRADNDSLDGQAGNDVLRGAAGNDTLTGDSGADTLGGGNGDDLLLGGSEADDLRGGNGRDTLEGGDHSDIMRGHANDDVLRGDGGNDKLLSGAGNDEVHGGSGEDRISGGLGNDTMSGDAGADTFVFGATFGCDEVTDFSLNEGDILRINDAQWTGTYGTLSDLEVISTFGSIDGNGDVVLIFPSGDCITLTGVTTLAGLEVGLDAY